jgi:hypothetical protein
LSAPVVFVILKFCLLEIPLGVRVYFDFCGLALSAGAG